MFKLARQFAIPTLAAVAVLSGNLATARAGAPVIASVQQAPTPPGAPPAFGVIGSGFKPNAPVMIWLLDNSTKPYPTGEFSPVSPADVKPGRNAIQYADQNGNLTGTVGHGLVVWHYPPRSGMTVSFNATDLRMTPGGAAYLYSNSVAATLP